MFIFIDADDTNTAVICEKTSQTLICDNERVIDVALAIYGRTSPDVCVGLNSEGVKACVQDRTAMIQTL